MPSPLLHFAAGAGICQVDRPAFQQAKLRLIVPVMLASVLPDFDVLPGFAIGDPNRFHGGCTHSLGFAALAAIIVMLVSGTMRYRVAFWVFASWSTHCLLDAMTADGRPPYGVPLFWPITTKSFHLSSPCFAGFHHGGSGVSRGEFLSQVLSIENARVMLSEMAIGIGFVLAGAMLGRVAKRKITKKIRIEET